jgi:organic radical activating enzyme
MMSFKQIIKLATKKFIVNHFPKSISKFSRIWFLKLSAKKRLAPRQELRFDVHLVDHCNLNCKGCLHFSPLSAEKYLDIQTFEKDLKKLSDLTQGKVQDICLLGGEPLLHPDIELFLPIARRYFPEGRINILTNGLLLPKMTETFYETCKKYKIEISVSYYPVKIDIEKIKELTNQYSIPLEIRDEYRKGTSTWLRQPLDIDGQQNNEKSYTTCAMGNFCIQLIDGKIYQCETVAYIHYFNEYFDKNIIVQDNDYINIYSVADIKEIFNFLCKPMPFCRYCKTKDIEYVPWDNSKKRINEWV